MILRIALGYMGSIVKMILQTGLWICLLISIRGVWTRAALLKEMVYTAPQGVFFLGLIVWSLTFMTAILCGGFLLLYWKGK